MHKKTLILACSLICVILSHSQNALNHFTEAIETRYSNKQPVVHYIVTVDSEDISFFHVEMRIKNAPDNFQLAMVTHPEYDDRFWRFVEDFVVETDAGKGKIVREDSSLWRVTKKGN